MPPQLACAKIVRVDFSCADVRRVDFSWDVSPLTRFGEELNFSDSMRNVGSECFGGHVDPMQTNHAVGPIESVFRFRWKNFSDRMRQSHTHRASDEFKT